MTLSGGTTGLSLSINDSRRFASRTWDLRFIDGFIMRLWGERRKKKVDLGNLVMACRRAGTIAQLRGELPIS